MLLDQILAAFKKAGLIVVVDPDGVLPRDTRLTPYSDAVSLYGLARDAARGAPSVLHLTRKDLRKGSAGDELHHLPRASTLAHHAGAVLFLNPESSTTTQVTVLKDRYGAPGRRLEWDGVTLHTLAEVPPRLSPRPPRAFHPTSN